MGLMLAPDPVGTGLYHLARPFFLIMGFTEGTTAAVSVGKALTTSAACDSILGKSGLVLDEHKFIRAVRADADLALRDVVDPARNLQVTRRDGVGDRRMRLDVAHLQ